MLKTSTKIITDSLFSHFNADKGYKYQLCNSYVFQWECDFFCMAKSGFCYEIEVKVSRNDFFADFRKEEKHTILSAPGKHFIKKIRVCEMETWEQLASQRFSWNRSSYIEILNLQQIRPNKFLYAVPAGLIDPSEVPEYAGLIYVYPEGNFEHDIIEIKKRPPAIHRAKMDLNKTLLEKYYWAYLNMVKQTDSGKNFQFPNQEKPGNESI